MLSVHVPNMNGTTAVTSNEATRPSAHRPASLALPPHPLLSAGIPPSPRFGPSNSARPNSDSIGSARIPTREVEALDQWFENFRSYEATLEDMAAASTDPKFNEELGTIEHWFRILSESERTATLYTLVQHSSQLQIRFLVAVLQQMLKSDANPPPTASLDGQMKSKTGNRNARPPSLNLLAPDSPAMMNLPSALESATLRSAGATPAKTQVDQMPKASTGAQELVVTEENSWASMVKTPSTPMFNNSKSKKSNLSQSNGAVNSFPGFSNAGMGVPNFMNNPYGLGMLGQMGLSAEAQVLAMQMMMSGLMPGQLQMPPAQNQRGNQAQRQPSRNGNTNNWRTSANARYPSSALRSAGLKSAGLKSAGLKSAGLKSSGLASAASATSVGTPREEDFDPELLNDIPAWLKVFRLHKYTECFSGMTWQQMVDLDDAALETRGVTTLGARRRMLRTFEMVRRKMGMEPLATDDAADSTTPTLAKETTPDAQSSPLTAEPAPTGLTTAPSA